ncbi:hypothetical protein CONPUDRAFT_123622, partial [Coniophora puteana RWD-64-598 SS2]
MFQTADFVFNIKTGLDPFRDPEAGDDLSKFDLFRKSKAENDKRQAIQCVGQLVQYSAQLLAQQHRTSCFIILVCGRRARFIRWDRAGAMVTRAFNYTKSDYLLEFLWRYDQASDTDRGVDTSHHQVTSEEEQAFKCAIEKHIELQFFDTPAETTDRVLFSTHLEEHYEPGNVTKMDVFDELSKSTKQYLVSKPFVSPENATGRCTRGYWAVEVNDPDLKVVFIKDTWQICEKGERREDAVYRSLNGNNVANVPTLCAHGDVRHRNGSQRYQRTVTQNYLD